jgi:hypothetical protein
MSIVSVRDLFEAHLTVADLQRSMNFFGQVLGLKLARHFPQRKVAFYWIGGKRNSMLGLWEVGTGPQRMSLHVASDGNSLKLLSMLSEAPQPELGIVSWTQWRQSQATLPGSAGTFRNLPKDLE